MQNAIQGILPICCKCKKIRAVEANPNDPMAWKRIEVFLSEKIDVDFSHGYCPECYAEEMKDLQKITIPNVKTS